MRIKTRLLPLLLALCLALPLLAGAEVTRQETIKYGKVAEATWTDESGNPAPGPDGYTTVRYTYNGSETTERYYDAAGEPYRMPGGYYGQSISRDGKKRVIGITYLDENGKKTLTDLGYARVKMEYTSFDEQKNLVYYGERNPVVVPSLGYAQVKTEFRGKTMTKRTWMDAAGNPMDTPMGYAVMIQRINKKNQVLGIQYTHADGSPATCSDGWASAENELDGDGRVLWTKYYTAEGVLTDRGRGYAWEETSYPAKDRTETRRFGLDGSQVAYPEGYMVLARTLSEDRVISEKFLDGEGRAIALDAGYSEVRYSYDAGGALIQVSYYRADGTRMD